MLPVVGNEKPVLSDGFCRELAAENPLGDDITIQDVRDWFDLKWLQYRERGYSNHRRAIIRWWSNLTEAELSRARERASRLRERAEAKRMREIEEAVLRDGATEAPQPVPGLRVVSSS